MRMLAGVLGVLALVGLWEPSALAGPPAGSTMSYVDSGSAAVIKGIPKLVLSGKSMGDAKGHRLDNLRLSIKPTTPTKEITQLRVEVKYQTLKNQTVSVGTLDARFLKPVAVGDILFFEYNFPKGLEIASSFLIEVSLDFGADVSASTTGTVFW